MNLRVHCGENKFYLTVPYQATIGVLLEIIKNEYKKLYSTDLRIKYLCDDKNFLIPHDSTHWKVCGVFSDRDIVHVEIDSVRALPLEQDNPIKENSSYPPAPSKPKNKQQSTKKRKRPSEDEDDEEYEEYDEDTKSRSKSSKSQRTIGTFSQQTSNQLSKELPMTPTQRDDAKFNWLRSLDTIKSNTGTFVELPEFQCDLPKDFSSTVANNFFLTSQRAALLEQIINDFERKERFDEKGFVLAGPHGMGKTCFSYLVASYAWVNMYPLIYIVCF